jgi:hypothetical protein
MNNVKKYTHFLESIKNDINSELMETVIKGFQAIHESSSPISMEAMDIDALIPKLILKQLEDVDLYAAYRDNNLKGKLDVIADYVFDDILYASLEGAEYSKLRRESPREHTKSDEFYDRVIQPYSEMISPKISEYFSDLDEYVIDDELREIIFKEVTKKIPGTESINEGLGAKVAGGAAIAGAIASGALDDSENIKLNAELQEDADKQEIEYQKAQEMKRFLELQEKMKSYGFDPDSIQMEYDKVNPTYK